MNTPESSGCISNDCSTRHYNRNISVSTASTRVDSLQEYSRSTRCHQNIRPDRFRVLDARKSHDIARSPRCIEFFLGETKITVQNDKLIDSPGYMLILDAARTLHRNLAVGVVPEARLWAAVRKASMYIISTTNDRDTINVFLAIYTACLFPVKLT